MGPRRTSRAQLVHTTVERLWMAQQPQHGHSVTKQSDTNHSLVAEHVWFHEPHDFRQQQERCSLAIAPQVTAFLRSVSSRTQENPRSHHLNARLGVDEDCSSKEVRNGVPRSCDETSSTSETSGTSETNVSGGSETSAGCRRRWRVATNTAAHASAHG